MPTETQECMQNDAEAAFTKLFLTPEGRANPYPLYHQLRATAPVHHAKMGMSLLSRYDDCRVAMRDPRLGKDHAPSASRRHRAGPWFRVQCARSTPTM